MSRNESIPQGRRTVFSLRTAAGAAEGAYLVPTDFFGHLGTFTDFFLLQPTGLGFLLDPVGEILVGNPPF